MPAAVMQAGLVAQQAFPFWIGSPGKAPSAEKPSLFQRGGKGFKLRRGLRPAEFELPQDLNIVIRQST